VGLETDNSTLTKSRVPNVACMYETGGDDCDVQEIVEAPKTIEAETDATATVLVL
jgi:hypothetical protein